MRTLIPFLLFLCGCIPLGTSNLSGDGGTFYELEEIFKEADADKNYPWLNHFYSWGQKGFSSPSPASASVEDLLRSVGTLEENHDQYGSIIKLMLDYEIEKKQKMLGAVSKKYKKTFLQLVKLEATDFSDFVHVLVDGKFDPQAHNNLARFYRYSEEGETQKIFGGFRQAVENSPHSQFNLSDFKEEEARFVDKYVNLMTEKWKNSTSLKSRLQNELTHLKKIRTFLQSSSFDKINHEELAASLKGNLIPFAALGSVILAAEGHSPSEEEVGEEQALEKKRAAGCPFKDATSEKFQVTMKENVLNLRQSFIQTVEKTLDGVNQVAQSEGFLAEVRKRTYSGFSVTKVLDYINKSKYQVKLGGRRFSSRVYASAGVCAGYIYLNSRKQYRRGAGLAATLFHEITHNLGFYHTSRVPYPLGDVMRKHYALMFPEDDNTGEEEGPGPKKPLPFPKNYIFNGDYPVEEMY